MSTVEESKSKQVREPVAPPKGVVLLRISEAAWMLRMSVTTVRRLVKAGKLDYRETPAGIRFHISDLNRYVDTTRRCVGEPKRDEHAAKVSKAVGIPIDGRVDKQITTRRRRA